MKLHFFCFITFSLLLFATEIIYAQNNWERTGPISFTGIQKINSKVILCCTDAGSFYLSSDDGVNWTHRLINGNRIFQCIRFFDSLNGIIGANGGFIEKTTDGGITWHEHTIGVSADVISLSYPNSDIAYIACSDGKLRRTIDGGSDWDTISFKLTNPIVKKVVFPTALYGVVSLQNEIICITSNGGVSWSEFQGLKGTEITALDATIDGKIAYGTSDGFINTTLDHINWIMLPSPRNDTLKYSIDVLKIHNDTIYIFERQKKHWLIATFENKWWAKALIPDSETTAQTFSLAKGMQFNDIYFDDDKGAGLVVGTYGTIYKISNFGMKGELLHHCNIGWSDQNTGNSWLYLEGLKRNSNYIHAIALFGPFGFSSDKGATWFSRNEINYGFTSYIGLHFSDTSTGVIINSPGKNKNIVGFLNTQNNGASWDYLARPPHDNLHSLTLSNTGRLYATGDSTVYMSSDGGYGWIPSLEYFDTAGSLSSFKSNYLRSSFFLNNDSLIFLNSAISGTNEKGSFYVTNLIASTDGGKIWQTRYTFPNGLQGAESKFISPLVGYIALSPLNTVKDSINGRLWKTLDGGFHWSIIPNVYGKTFFQPPVFSKNNKYGITIGAKWNEIFFTKDSGYTWFADSVVYSGSTANIIFYFPYFIDDSTAFIVSNVGFWTKTLSDVKASVEVRPMTSNQYLFITTNPSPAYTNTIHCGLYGLFSLNNVHSLSLKIYDLVGKEVMDISKIAQDNSNGITAFFDIPIQKLTAGVYILNLATDNGGFTKKIVVTK
jgi:photosystem II stability/assembly factor-like uncharacterized protein